MTNSTQPTTALEDELQYRFQERLGILCEDRKPTNEQLAIAMREIKEWTEERMKEANK